MLTGSVNIMTLRLSPTRTSRAVHKAAEARGINTPTIAKAIGLDMQGTHDRLAGVVPFTVTELVQVGGLLSVSPDQFFREDTTA